MGKALMIPNVSFASSGLGKVTLTGNVSPVAISIVGSSNVFNEEDNAKYSVIYNPVNTTQRSITWSIESGGTYASINQSTGTLTVLEGADGSTVIIKATSTSNPSVYATKTVMVTYSGAHTLTPLSYIAADGGMRIDTGKASNANMTIKADFKIANITINDSTDRQIVYTDGAAASTTYSKRWNLFAINFVGANTKTINTFYNRGVVESSASGATLFDKNENIYVSMNTSSVVSGDFGELMLFASTYSGHTFKKVLIYEFSTSENGVDTLNLTPFLYDGVPCFYESVSETYLYFVGESGNIWYATAAEPNTEIFYSPSSSS